MEIDWVLKDSIENGYKVKTSRKIMIFYWLSLPPSLLPYRYICNYIFITYAGFKL